MPTPQEFQQRSNKLLQPTNSLTDETPIPQEIWSKSNEILWDTYGVPHIYSKDTPSLFYSFGWAQMQSHGNLILRLYGQARGKAAQYWGEKYTESDRWVLTMGVPDRARSWYDAQNSNFRKYLDAFAAGINAYAREHGDLIDDEVEVVLPVKGEDLLAHGQRVLNFSFVVDASVGESLSKNLAGRMPTPQESLAGRMPTPQESLAGRMPTPQESLTGRMPTPQEIGSRSSTLGSNAWAIAPSRSTSGNAMLLANPHLPWSDFFLWYEAHLNAPGMNAYGATLVGIPVLAIAFNDNLGWTHTVNTHDGWDAYKLTLADGGYRFDGKVEPFQTQEVSLKVKQNDSSLREEKLLVRRSIHGPIVIEKDGLALALRVVGLARPGVLEQWWDMARATNFAEFETALKRLQLPMFTVMYADKEGHIMHLFNGQVPVRSQGDFKYWSGVIPGDTSATLWTKMHPYQDLPRVVDPASGWLQNANDPPWTTTFPVAIAANNYPPYIAPRGPMYFRAQRSAKMLDEDERISFEEMIEYKHSTRMELADRILDDLIPAARKYGDELARQAADVLAAWDRFADAESRGAVLFSFWFEDTDFNSMFSIPWNENYPRTTPDGLADPQSAAKLLSTAAAKVKSRYGKLDVAWGDVYRLRSPGVDLPANGGAGGLGIFRVLNFTSEPDGRFKSIDGDSFVAAIEFSQPVRAMALTSYGNSTQPNSAHSRDQLPLFASKKLRPVWRTRQEILAHLASRQVL